jgi:hypothetical protein
MRQHNRSTMDEKRQRTTSVGQDDLAGVGSQRARREQVDGGATRFMWVVEHGLRERRANEGFVDGVRGVDEDDCLAFIKFGPNGTKRCGAKVVVRRAVPGEERYAMGTKAEGVRYLG